MNFNQDLPLSKIFTWKLVVHGNEYRIEDALRGSTATSLDEVSKLLPQGAYTTFRTYFHSRILRVDEHIQRLIDSSIRVNQPVFIDPIPFRTGLRKIILRNPYPEARVRITVDLEKEPGCFFISLEQLHIPPEAAYKNGVKTNTFSMHRDNPRAKLTGFIQTAAEFRASMPAGVNEILMLDEKGLLLEGLSSNFFGMAGGELFTADEGVLNGITRSLVLEIAATLGIPQRFEGIPVQQLKNLEECFITSASRAVLPVIQIDDVRIGDGLPGPVTHQIMTAFFQRVEKEAQEI